MANALRCHATPSPEVGAAMSSTGQRHAPYPMASRSPVPSDPKQPNVGFVLTEDNAEFIRSPFRACTEKPRCSHEDSPLTPKHVPSAAGSPLDRIGHGKRQVPIGT